MLDLKPYYDAVLTTDAEVKRVANEINALFQGETDEGKAQALALRPALDEAQKKADEAMTLYEAMKKANRPSDIAKNFVPVSNTSTTPDEETPAGTMTRSDFEALNTFDRMAFIKSGGQIEA